MNNQGFERAPISSLHDKPKSRRGKISRAGLEAITMHDYRVRQFLSVGEATQFVATDAALSARKEAVRSWPCDDRRGRPLCEMASLMVGSTIQLVNECRGSSVLEIGCGEGRFSTELALATDAQITSVEPDPEILKKVPQEAGKTLVADGRFLPFKDEDFDKVFEAWSAISYAESHSDAALALNEAIRVAKVGGTTFLAPVWSHYMKRDREMSYGSSDPSVKIGALQDHVLFHALQSLMRDDYISVTWAGMFWQYDGIEPAESRRFDMISAIIDKKKSIPPEVFKGNITYADSFTS